MTIKIRIFVCFFVHSLSFLFLSLDSKKIKIKKKNIHQIHTCARLHFPAVEMDKWMNECEICCLRHEETKYTNFYFSIGNFYGFFFLLLEYFDHFVFASFFFLCVSGLKFHSFFFCLVAVIVWFTILSVLLYYSGIE